MRAWFSRRLAVPDSVPKDFHRPSFGLAAQLRLARSFGPKQLFGITSLSRTTSFFWTTTRSPEKRNSKNRAREHEDRFTYLPGPHFPGKRENHSLVKCANCTRTISTRNVVDNRSPTQILSRPIHTPCKTGKQSFSTKTPSSRPGIADWDCLLLPGIACANMKIWSFPGLSRYRQRLSGRTRQLQRTLPQAEQAQRPRNGQSFFRRHHGGSGVMLMPSILPADQQRRRSTESLVSSAT